MIIELQSNNGKSDFPEICCTELTAPTVIENKGRFFLKTPCDQRICSTVVKYLLYRECRGEVLNNIAIVRTVESEEVLA